MWRSWEELPLLKVALLFICGIVLGLKVDVDLSLFCLSIFFLTIFIATFNFKKYWLKRLAYYLCLVNFLLLGTYRMHIGEHQHPSYGHEELAQIRWCIVEIENIRVGKNSIIYTSKIINSPELENKQPEKSKIEFYAPASFNSFPLGSIIGISTPIRAIQKPENPHQFNFQAFQRKKKVIGSSFINASSNFIVLKMPAFTKTSYRSRVQSTLAKHLPDAYSLSVTGAILFGIKGGLDKNEMDLYRKSGVAHIMAVSGMHVGIIYGIIWIFLSRIRSGNIFGKVLRTLISLASIWTFIGISGFPPSAVRAGVMFSFLILGKAFYLHTQSLNLLLASAIILLVINPFWVTDIGFQFSYLALIGILLFYQSLDKLVAAPWKLLNWIWSLISISLAAQAFLLPLSIYYFHGFSPWFWLNSIPASLMATIVMSLALLILLVSGLSPYMGDLLGILLSKSILLFKNWLTIASSFPHHFIDQIGIDLIDLILFFCIGLSIIFAIISSRYKITFIIVILSLSLLFRDSFIGVDRKKYLNTLYMKNEWLLYLSSGNETIRLTSSDKQKDIHYISNGFEIKNHLTCIHKFQIFEKDHLLQFHGINILAVSDYQKFDNCAYEGVDVIFWWAPLPPDPIAFLDYTIQCIYLRKSTLNKLNESDLSFFELLNIEILTPGQPHLIDY